jgi:hypothetical protein
MSDQFTSGGTPEGASLPPEATAATASWWEDYMDIFYTPSSVFARRASSGFGIPMLVVTLLIGLIFLANSGVMQPIMDAEFTRATAAAMKKSPQVTAEQMGQVRSMTEKFAAVGVFIMMPITIACIGVVLWLVGKFVDAKQTVGAAVMVAAYAYLPRVLEGIVNGVQAQLMDPAKLTGRYALSLGVGRFFDPDTASPLLLGIVGRLDLFTIWVTVLLVIGLSVTGKIPRQKAAIAGVIVWIIGALPGVLGALPGALKS